MTNAHRGCPLNIPPGKLSALFDNDLGPKAAEALHTHVSSCPTCQRHLAAYERIRRTLKEQNVPQPDAHLRQDILAAREHITPRPHTFRWADHMWRNLAIAAVVALIVGGLAGLLINRAIGQHIVLLTKPTATTHHTPTSLATATAPQTPPGWRIVLPTLRLTGLAGNQGLAVSPARQGRLVGCGLPRPTAGISAASVTPVLLLSDNGGQSWQKETITGLGQVSDCVVVVDQRLPDTFAVGNADASQLVMTNDAGKSWHQLALPPGRSMVFASVNGYLAPVLDNGHLIGIFYTRQQASRYTLADLALDGSFRVLDATLPYPSSQTPEQSPEAFVVDPANPLHILILTYNAFDAIKHPTHDLVLFATTNNGATWTRQHVFTNAEREALWLQPSGILYTYHLTGLATGENVFEQSSDGGVTWRPGLAATVQVGDVWFGPIGRAVIFDSAQNALVEVNLSTGKVSASLGSLPHVSSSSGFLGIVAEGTSPVFIAAGIDATYARPLP